MADVLLITPPFFFYNTPHTGLSLLKAMLNEHNISSEILYCNLEYRERISPALYDRISLSLASDLVGESIFAAEAFPAAHKAHVHNRKRNRRRKFILPGPENYLTPEELLPARAQATSFLDYTAAVVTEKKPVIAGFNSSYNQLCACIAVADRIKKRLPAAVTAIGGYNCLEPMNTALSFLTSSLDYIFSGEGEYAFLNFCREILEGKRPSHRLITCAPVTDLDALPCPDFSDYFAASRVYNINPEEIILSPEGSRGCAWGDHSRCLFCGAAGETTPYRKKSSARFKNEINQLTNLYRCSRIFPADMAIAPGFITDPAGSLEYLEITDGYCETRPDLDYSELRILKKNHFHALQSGIETFHDKLLAVLKKGTTCLGNIRFLRDCLNLDINVNWVFIHTIPGEREEDYREMLEILPSLYHLQPPVLITPLILQRYSPLFRQQMAHGLETPEPCPVYYDIFPENTDFAKLAVCFRSEYPEAIKPCRAGEEVISVIKEWQLVWHTLTPRLTFTQAHNGFREIKDTRQTWKGKTDAEKKEGRTLNDKHWEILKKTLVPLPEAELRTAIQKNSGELEELLEWQFLIRHKGNLLSLVPLSPVP